MARVKKSGSRAGASLPARKDAKRPAVRGGDRAKAKTSKHGAGAKYKGAATKPAASYRVRELNAQDKCGPGTSVERLFRVDETLDGTARAHLVFLDRRHGWYCEHGVQCPAVGQARRMGDVRTPQDGRT